MATAKESPSSTDHLFTIPGLKNSEKLRSFFEADLNENGFTQLDEAEKEVWIIRIRRAEALLSKLSDNTTDLNDNFSSSVADKLRIELETFIYDAKWKIIFSDRDYYYQIAWRNSASPQVVDDMVQEMMLGLYKYAIDKYDPSLGNFTTYSTWWLRKFAKNLQFSTDTVFQLTVRMVHTRMALYRAINRLKIEHGVEPTETDIYEFLLEEYRVKSERYAGLISHLGYLSNFSEAAIVRRISELRYINWRIELDQGYEENRNLYEHSLIGQSDEDNDEGDNEMEIKLERYLPTLQNIISKIPDKTDRELFQLYCNLPTLEMVAEESGIPVPKLRTRLRRINSQIKEQFERETKIGKKAKNNGGRSSRKKD